MHAVEEAWQGLRICGALCRICGKKMWIAKTKTELRDRVGSGRVVLVPTMGALHAGHVALIRRAREVGGEEGLVVVSVFVNPIQFDRPGDLRMYPRPLEADLSACEEQGADGVFLPSDEEMYAGDRSVVVLEGSLSKGLCGATRPGHFDGVCTVVLKLFLLTRCMVAVFGEKDFQQLAIIRRMIRDLDVEVEIVACPTVREDDGLAMSSRNVRLNLEQRADAPRIRKALLEASSLAGVGAMEGHARRLIEASPLARVDYISLVDAETLEPVSDLNREAVLACAVFYGEVRLIDHVAVTVVSL